MRRRFNFELSMKNLIESVNGQITEAIEIANQSVIKITGKKINAVLVCGLGGSGIGGKIISYLYRNELKVPFMLTNDYTIPACVNENTLVIASSYSGNTEETIEAVVNSQKVNAEIVVISSGGKLVDMAKENGWNHIIVPGGQQPRAMLIYSIIQQINILSKYELTGTNNFNELNTIANFLDNQKTQILAESGRIANFLTNKTPVIYSGVSLEGVAIRFKQQLNENSKVLCMTHVFPEMTHNELVGWAGGNENFAVVYLHSNFDHNRSAHRWLVSKPVIQSKTPHVTEIKSPCDTQLQEVFYYIHLTDWVSIKLAELRNVDYVEVDVISHLKSEMSKLN